MKPTKQPQEEKKAVNGGGASFSIGAANNNNTKDLRASMKSTKNSKGKNSYKHSDSTGKNSTDN